MARVLPSGRVFGEAVALPRIDFAKEAHPMETLQKAATSDLAGLAVAGISRIKDEIDYADRLEAEKRRVAGAQIAERKAEAALGALQEQQTARTAAMEQHEAQRQQRIRTFAGATGQLEALERGEEIDLTKGRPEEGVPWRPVHRQEEETMAHPVAAKLSWEEGLRGRREDLSNQINKRTRTIHKLTRTIRGYALSGEEAPHLEKERAALEKERAALAQQLTDLVSRMAMVIQ